MSDPKGNPAQSHPIPSQAAPGGPPALTRSGLCLGKLPCGLRHLGSPAFSVPVGLRQWKAVAWSLEGEQGEPQCSRPAPSLLAAWQEPFSPHVPTAPAGHLWGWRLLLHSGKSACPPLVLSVLGEEWQAEGSPRDEHTRIPEPVNMLHPMEKGLCRCDYGDGPLKTGECPGLPRAPLITQTLQAENFLWLEWDQCCNRINLRDSGARKIHCWF